MRCNFWADYESKMVSCVYKDLELTNKYKFTQSVSSPSTSILILLQS